MIYAPHQDATLPEPGIHFDVDPRKLRRWPALSYSRLKKMRRTPAHGVWDAANPSEPSAAMLAGNVTDILVTGGDIDDHLLIAPKRERRKNVDKEWWTAFEAAARLQDRRVVKADQFEKGRAMAEAVLAHPEARRYIEGLGAFQVGILGEIDGHPCKALADWIGEHPDDRGPCAADLKTTKNAGPGYHGFRREVGIFAYHWQAALSRDLLSQHDAASWRWVWICVESFGSHEVAVWEAPAACLKDGRDEYRKAVAAYAACVENGEWPGYPVETMMMEWRANRW